MLLRQVLTINAVPVGGFVNIAAYFGVGLKQVYGLLNWPVLTLGLGVSSTLLKHITRHG